MRSCRWMILATAALAASIQLAGQAVWPAKGDLNNDGAVDATDGVLLANYQAGNIGELRAGGDLYAVDRIAGVLRCVPAGTFVQGSPEYEPCRSWDETQFTHTLTRNLAVMATEVTRLMWAVLREKQPSLPADPTSTSSGAGLDNPVQTVSWYEAVLFANLLSVQRGLTRCYYKDAALTQPVDAGNYTSGSFYCNFDADGYRLPSEGEWEYACRAGTTTPFWIDEPNYTWDNCWVPPSDDVPGTWPQLETAAWFCANEEDPAGLYTSKPAGTKAPNPWGLHDNHGNVLEWCWDWYGTYPSGSATDHWGAGSGPDRVFRGGFWVSTSSDCRSAARAYAPPGNRYYNLGFRLVRTIG